MGSALFRTRLSVLDLSFFRHRSAEGARQSFRDDKAKRDFPTPRISDWSIKTSLESLSSETSFLSVVAFSI